MTIDRNTRLLLSALLLLSLGSLAGDCGTGPEYRLVWSSEFNGAAGLPPDENHWRFDIGNGSNGWGNAQLEYDTSRPENVAMDGDGCLAITAREESHEGFDYTSARIHTQGLFDHGPGRFEARIKLPRGRGIWPAFWLLGSDFGHVGWPNCGEIDIMEYRGQQPRVVMGTLHGPGYSGGQGVGGSFTHPEEGFDEEFHVFAIEWTGSGITWGIDGVAYQTFSPAHLPSGAEWVFDHPFFIILNVAVGGHFVGSPDESTVFPQTMLVDWVRVYRLES